MNATTFKTISTRSELEEVGRLRYQAFIVERGCCIPEADHVNKVLLDPIDEYILQQGDQAGYIVAACEGNDMVGTVRMNPLNEFTVSYEKMYRCGELNLRLSDQPTITSRLCTSSVKRNSTFSLRLIKAGYEKGIYLGSKINFMDCNSCLISFFQRFGYHETFPAFEHPSFGTIHPMALLMEDFPHFREVRSPFLEFQHAITIDPLALSRLRLSLKRVQHTYSTLIQSPIYYEYNH